MNATERPTRHRAAIRRAARSFILCAIAGFVLFARGEISVHSQGQPPERVAEGTLEVLYEDAADGARIRHFLNTGTERIPLRFRQNPPRHLLTGSRIRARGTAQSDGTLMLTSGSDSGSVTTMSLATPYTFGAQSTLVILFNFSDLATQPFTTATAQSTTFTDANNFDLENSFGQTWLEGTVAGWFTIAAASTTCSYNTWAMQADQAATNAGFNLGDYPRRVYAFPQTSACGWIGLGTVGGGGTASNPSRAWINGSFTPQAVAHEMGHNFGLYHSHSNTCDSTGCVVAEYGDDHDVMGNYAVGHFNAYQKERLGWLNYGSSPSIQTVTAAGSYALEPYETTWSGLPKALEILQSSSGGSNTTIYVEARTQNGVDASLTPGVLIHTGVDTDGNQSLLQDVLPTSTSTDFILDPGQSMTFTAVPPITVTTLSADNTGAVVAVTNSTAPCTYSLGSSGQSMGSGGGGGSVALTTASDCDWVASSNASWITIGAGSTSGVGSATIQFTVDANTLSTQRVGTLTITGQTYTVTQAGVGCSFTVAPTSQAFNLSGGTGTVAVTTPAGCAWTAHSNSSFVTVTSGASGSGNGSVQYSVASKTSGSRSGTMTVAGKTVTITQSTVSDTSLAVAAASGTYAGTATLSATLTAGGTPVSGKTITFTVNGTSIGTATTNASGVATRSNATLTGIAAGSYVAGAAASFAGDSSFNASSGSNTLTVAQKSVTASVTAANKTYDRTANATLTNCSLTGVVGADVVTCASPASFASASVGTSKTVTATGLTLGGASAANYALTSTTATTTANITAGTVTATVTAASKPYDKTTAATISNCTLTGVLSGDTVTCAAGAATFDTPNVGTSKTVTATSLTLGGASAANYALTSTTATTTAAITAGAVTATVTAASKPYDKTTAATISNCTLAGVVGGDTVTCAAGAATFDTPTVGTGKPVTATSLTLGGASAANYALTSTTATTTASISAISVTPTVRVADKPYDSTTSATLTSCTVSGLLAGDVVNCSGVAAFADASAGFGKPVIVSSLSLIGAAAPNYTLSTTTAMTTADVEDPFVTATVTAADKLYDGTTTAVATCALSGVLGNDDVSCSGVASFDTASVGTGKTVTVSNLTLSGAAAGNYTLSNTTATTTAAITPVSVVPAVTIADKSYDGTTTASLTSCTVANSVFIAWDPNPSQEDVLGYIVSVGTASGVYEQTFDVGNQTSFVYPNALPGQQYFFAVASYNANGTGSQSEVSGVAQASGVVDGDVVSCTGEAASFDTATAGTNKTVTVTGLTLSGAAAGNYALSSTTVTATASIAPAVVTPVVVVADKTYDGTTSATVANCTPSGVIGSDVAVCSGGVGTFESSGAGSRVANVTGLVLTGTDAGNYTLAFSSTIAAATINAVTVTPTVTVADKLYDGSTTAALSGCSLTGLVNGDAVGCDGAAAFATPDAGVGKVVTVSDLTLTGAAANNYTLASTVATATASIVGTTVMPALIVADKPYDGNTFATLASCTVGGAVTDGLVAAYSFDEGTGTTVTDSSGHGNAGTVIDATWTPDGIHGGALSFNGFDSRVVVPDAASLHLTTAMTIEAWVMPTTVDQARRDVIHKGADDYYLAASSPNAERPLVGATASPSAIEAYGQPLSENAWTHLVGTYDGTTVRLYVNGVNVSSVARTIDLTTSTDPVEIGAASLYGEFFEGIIDEVRIYNVALTPTQVYANMVSGTVGGRTLACTATATFDTAEVGTGKTVTLTNLALSGADAANFTLASTTATATAAITAATLVPTVTVANKPYDGTTAASLTNCALAGVFGSDQVACAGTATFDTASAGVAKSVTVTGLALTGAAAGNYTLAATTATTTANVAAAGITAAVTAANKTYDRTTAAAITSCSLSGVFGADAVSCAAGQALFDTPSVGSGKPVTASALTLSGAAAGNYTLVSPTALTTADIVTAPVTATVTAADKVFDGTAAASVTSCIVNGVFGGDSVTCSGTAAFDSATAGVGKVVTVTGLTLGGAAAGNYALAADSATTTATITKATPVITWATPADIVQGTPLDASQLDATASTEGAFVYSPSAGTVLSAGAQTLSATFTPSDTIDFASVTQTVTLNVRSAAPTIEPIGNVTTVIGTATSFVVKATDPNANAMRFDATGLPPGVAIDPDSGAITGTPSALGTFAVTLHAVDVVVNASTEADFSWTIVPASAGRVKFVQANSQTASGRPTAAVPFVSPQNAGDLSVVAIAWQDGVAAQIASVTDSQGNAYTAAAAPIAAAGVGSQAIYYASNIVAAPAGSNIVTVTFTAPVSLVDVRTAEYNGIEPLDVIDAVGGASGTGTLADTGTVVTSYAKDLLLAASFVPGTSASAGAGFTPRVTTAVGSLVEDTTVAVAGPHNATVSLSVPAEWIIQIVAFRDTNQPPVVTNPGNQSSAVGATVSLTVLASDPDSDALTYSATGLPRGLTIAGATGVVSGTIASTGAGIHTVTVSATDGNASATQTFVWTVRNAAGNIPVLRHDDFDGDGKSDIVVYRPSAGSWFVLKSQANFTTQMSFAWGTSTDVPVLGDYDGDGKPDPAFFRPSTGEWKILLSSTNYTSTTTVTWGAAGDLPVPGDYDGDGRTDVAVFHPATRQWKVLYSSANYTAGTTVTWGGSTDIPVPGDYDGDGKTDIAVYHRATGEWQILSSSTSAPVTVMLGGSTDIPVPADYDGDGKTDVAVFSRAAGQWKIVKSTTGATTTVSWGGGSDLPVPGDYDGDGKADLTVFRPGDGHWYVLESHSNYTTQWNVAWGTATDRPGPDVGLANALTVLALPIVANVSRIADVDGDGKTDVVVYRPSSGTWYVLKSQSNYTSQTAIAWGTRTDIPVPGDYDGDGKADAAFFRPSTGEWKILTSSSSYSTSMTVTLGGSGDLPVPGDYDGDGKTDVAIFHPATRQWQILYSSTGYATGAAYTFGARTDIPVPGDYDGDGITDLAVYHRFAGQWQILSSSTGYASTTTVTLGGGTDLPVPGDYDGDGKTDVAVYHRANGQWQIINSSTGATTTATWGTGAELPEPADYDGDGKTDLAVFTNGQWQILKSSSGTSLVISWGTTSDTAGPNVVLANTLTMQARPRPSDALRSADFDGDGKTDVTVYRPSTGTWYTLTSTSGYATQSVIPWGLSTDIAVAGDYDGDGKTDPAFYRPSTGEWQILYSSGNYTTHATFVWGVAGDLPVPGDYDGDGITDLAVFHPATGEWKIKLSSTGTTSIVAWGRWTDIPVPGDYDGDLITDIAVFHPATGQWTIRKSSTGETVTVAWGASADVPVPGDYDGDGKTDIAVYHRGQWQIINSGSGSTTMITWGASTDVPVPGDYDGDGKTDLVVFRPGNGTWFVLQSQSNYLTQFSVSWGAATDRPGASTIIANTLTVQAGPRVSDLTRASDFDGDGKADVAVFRPSDGSWNVLQSTTGFTSQLTVQWGTSADVPVPGDYDGDGRTDPAFFRPSTGEWQIVYAPAYTTPATFVWGQSGDIPVPGDYDGDGKTDLAVFRPSTGEWRILTSSSGYTASMVGVWGVSTDRPVPGDYDGDGKTDLAFFRPSTGQWQVLFSSTGYTTSMTANWGASIDVPVPADFDGDGKIDLAVYRPSNGTWYLLLSRSNWTSQQSIAWGATGDKPQVADFDGDGKADPTRFTATGWMILLSNAGYSTNLSSVLGTLTDIALPPRP